MKLLVHECSPPQADITREWIKKEVGLPIFREDKVLEISHNGPFYEAHRFIILAIDEEVESYLRLKFPTGTFKDCSA